MAKPTVYIETSVIGYLTSRLSGDLITAAHQKLTRVWWDQRRSRFGLHISDHGIDSFFFGMIVSP